MNANIITETARRTMAGTISFPEVVSQLLSAGVEYYHVDYVGRTKTFYTAEGGMVVASIDYEGLPAVAPEFSAEALRADIRDSQQNGQHYRDFTRRAMEAGVQGYFAYLRGRRVTYLGRQGDFHTEWFPGAGPRSFTADDIRAIYTRPTTGADFPGMIRALKGAGVASYEHLVETGGNVFFGEDGGTLALEKLGPACPVSREADLALLERTISEHQRGLSDFPTLCALVGRAGIAKWVCDLAAMSCSYFDRAGKKILVESIPGAGDE